MKFEELKKIVEENGYEFERDNFNYIINKKDSDKCIKVRIGEQGKVYFSEKGEERWNLDISKFSSLKDFRVIKAILDFVDTPVDQRGLKPLLIVRLKNSEPEIKLLGLDLITKETIVRKFRWREDEMYHFTLDEINEIKKKHNIDLDDFEILNVYSNKETFFV